MSVAWSSSTYQEFTRESHRIDEMIWAAIAVQPDTDVIFCGYENSLPIINRALEIGARVAVIETDSIALRTAAERGIETIRASTTNIPIREDRFSLAVAFHYLHEVDPSYHNQIIFEMGRISRRIAIIEPGPPTDLLGSRIASLYSRAKARLGQYEQYQPLEYWRRLLLGVRSHVNPAEIRHAHLPPRIFLKDTMHIVLESMRHAGAPDEDVRALERLAAASDAQLVPQPRFVILGGITAADIPERPRFAELQKQAPMRYSDRRRPASPIVRTETVRERDDSLTYAPQTLARRMREGMNRLNLLQTITGETQTPAPQRNPAFALPALPSTLPKALPIAQPKGAPMAAVPFGAPANSQTPVFSSPPGFGIEENAAASHLNELFSIPPMPGADSMEWSDGEGY